MKSLMTFLVSIALMAAAHAANTNGRPLEIYFIDVDGGQSTLIVTPRHRSLLVDAGFPGAGTLESKAGDPQKARDANRILAAANDAGLKQIDYLLVTHFHADHDGGIPELVQLIPIRTFIDHGEVNPEAEKNVPGTLEAFHAYKAVRAGAKHLEPKPGDRLPLKDVDAIVVSTRNMTLAKPLVTGAQAKTECGTAAIAPRDPYENPRSTGILLRFGQFRFLDVGDLTGEPLHDLVCPQNKVGHVDVYLVAHHGGPDAADAATFASFSPRVAIMNNGQKKGGSLETYTLLHRVPRLDVWQLHRSEAAGEQNFELEQIANIDESTAYWIKLTAYPDGHFNIANSRTGGTKQYR